MIKYGFKNFKYHRFRREEVRRWISEHDQKPDKVSEIEDLLSRMRGQARSNTIIQKAIGGDKKKKEIIESYSGFIATPPTVNTSVTASMINQTLWNATAEVTEREKEKGDQGSILENRKEVEEVRQELLDRISGSASHQKATWAFLRPCNGKKSVISA